MTSSKYDIVSLSSASVQSTNTDSATSDMILHGTPGLLASKKLAHVLSMYLYCHDSIAIEEYTPVPKYIVKAKFESKFGR